MASRTESRKFGTFELDGTNGINIARWRNRVLKEAKFSPRLRGEGSIVGRDTLTGHQVNIAGNVVAVDTGALRDRVDDLVLNLANGEQFLQFYSDRRLSCRLDGPVKYDVGPLGLSVSWSARFRSRWPWWEDPTPVNDQYTPTGVGPHTLTSAAVIAGTAPAFPVITIQTAFGFTSANLILTNTATMEQVQLRGLSMNNGQAIILNMREGFLGDGVASSITPRGNEGTYFSLSAGATSTIEVSHNVGSGASWTIDVDYVPQYWTL